MMKVRYNCHKGLRVKRYFIGIEVKGMWYSESTDEWIPTEADFTDKYPAATMFNCRTLRAAKRHIRKHPELHGKWVDLSNRYGCKDNWDMFHVRIKHRKENKYENK